jgi:hypothetical protein
VSGEEGDGRVERYNVPTPGCVGKVGRWAIGSKGSFVGFGRRGSGREEAELFLKGREDSVHP